jgi:uncharacterized protein (TIGR02271 family)
VNEHLIPLNQLDAYEVADDSSDVRGWPVHSTDDRRIGVVDELLVDTRDLKARYLIVDRAREAPAAGGGARLLFPVSAAHVDGNERKVRVSLAAAEIGSLPAYMAESGVPQGYDDSFRRAAPHEAEGREERRMTRSAEELQFRKREKPAGEVRVKKHVETEHVTQPVTREREDVRVERRPVSGRAAEDAKIGEDEIRVPIVEEEIVVEKRPVVKEELAIAKERITETTDIEADVRRERVDVERSRSEEDIRGRKR